MQGPHETKLHVVGGRITGGKITGGKITGLVITGQVEEIESLSIGHRQAGPHIPETGTPGILQREQLPTHFEQL